MLPVFSRMKISRILATLIGASLILHGLGAPQANAEELPNSITVRKVNMARYNLSLNLLDQYSGKTVALKIRRISGDVSSIINQPPILVGAEGRASAAIREPLLPSDVLLFTIGNSVIYKVEIKDVGILDLTKPMGANESGTVTSEGITSVVELPNNAMLRKMGKEKYLLTFNLLDQYSGLIVRIDRVRRIGSKSERLELGRPVVGEFGKGSFRIDTALTAGDHITITRFSTTIYLYTVESKVL